MHEIETLVSAAQHSGANLLTRQVAFTELVRRFQDMAPANVKRLRFLVAIQPASLGVLLRGYLRQVVGVPGWVLVPLVDWLCQWRGGYPLSAEFLLKLVREVHVPVLYVQGKGDRWDRGGEVESFYEVTPGAKEVCWLEESQGRLETYRHVIANPELISGYVCQQFRQDDQ